MHLCGIITYSTTPTYGFIFLLIGGIIISLITISHFFLIKEK